MSNPTPPPNSQSRGAMPYETYNYESSAPSPSPADNHDAIAGLSQEVMELREANEQVQNLRGQIRWLIGGLIAVVIIGGGILVGTILGFREQQLALQEEQSRLNEQIEALESERASAEQLNRLEEQLAALNERTQALGEQARVLAEQLPNLTSDQVSELQQRIQELEQGIRENVSGEAATRRLDQLTSIIQRILGNADNPPEQTTETP